MMRCDFKPHSVSVRTTSPRRTGELEIGATTMASPSIMLGRMLAPCARKRTLKPRPSSSRQTAENLPESRVVSVSIARMANGLHGALLGNEAKNAAGYCAGYALDEAEREFEALRAMAGNETARKNLGGGKAGSHAENFVVAVLLQKINIGDRR